MAGECQGNDADGGADRGGGGADENGELAYARGRAEGAHAAGQPVHEPGAGKGLQRIARTNDKRDPSGGGDIGGDGPRQHCRPDPKAPDESEPQGAAGPARAESFGPAPITWDTPALPTTANHLGRYWRRAQGAG